MELQQHTPVEKDLQIFQVANSKPCIIPPSGSILCSGSSVTHPLSVFVVRSGVHWRRRCWVGGWGKKARSLPKSASLQHFGPDRSATNTRASSIELPECATLSLSLHAWFWKQCDVKSSKIPYLLLRQMLKKRVVETCDWRGKKEPYFPQKWITKPSSCCGA